MSQEQFDLLLRLTLCAVGIGACVGFLLTAAFGQACDLLLAVIQRKQRHQRIDSL